MSGKLKFVFWAFLIICVIALSVRMYNIEQENSNIVESTNTPSATLNTGVNVPDTVNTSTPNISVTNTPINNVVVTSTPEAWSPITATPNNSVPQVTSTLRPAPVATNTPPVVVIPVVTSRPTQVPTATPKPTKATYSKTALEKVEKELEKISAGINEILPSYTEGKKYDLYKYISIDKVDPVKLFKLLERLYIGTIAHSFDFEFVYTDSVDGLRLTLNSAYCEKCGKLRCVYKEENTVKMRNLFLDVSSSEISKANKILMDFLYKNTIAGSNPSERLFVCCSCNK